MSTNSGWRLALARAVAVSAAAIVLLGSGAVTANAAPSLAPAVLDTLVSAAPAPIGPMTIEIHKFEQPAQLGQPSDGLEITDPTLLPVTPPVAGATFAATRVPGIDLTTPGGQQNAASLTLEQAFQLIDQSSALPEASDTTDNNGNATLLLPGTGLYFVAETVTPAGFVTSEPFLVALPLTNPQTRDGWLTTVHVYPKNARAAITLDVWDQNSVALGDTVHWRARADVPLQASLSGYIIRQSIDPRLELVGDADAFGVALDCAGCPLLVEGVDYTRALDAATGEYVFEFTRVGRAALIAAATAHPGATVTIDFDTRVLAEGILRNEASLLIGGSSKPVSDDATTQWGPLGIDVHEQGKPGNPIAGAYFQLYLTAEDAAARTNPITVDGRNEWVTDASGNIIIHGLRFSNFVNGLDRSRDDPLFRDYFVIMTKIPDGYTGEKVPIRLNVVSVTVPQIAVVELQRVAGGGGDDGDDDEGGLVVTGTQISGLAMLGALLVGVGLVIALRRKERDAPRTFAKQDSPA